MSEPLYPKLTKQLLAIPCFLNSIQKNVYHIDYPIGCYCLSVYYFDQNTELLAVTNSCKMLAITLIRSVTIFSVRVHSELLNKHDDKHIGHCMR